MARTARTFVGGIRHHVLNRGNGWASVWGLSYIDELVQVAHNTDPPDGQGGGDQLCETRYWALHNANYNVIGLVDSAGVLVERYEYTPYGQRKVFFSPGLSDPDCHAPTTMSQRVPWGAVKTAFALNPIGHQGLMHDEELDLIHNRARTLHPRLGRFMQRDPAGYVDGMSAYEYLGSRLLSGVDPTGESMDDVYKVIRATKARPGQCCRYLPVLHCRKLEDSPGSWLPLYHCFIAIWDTSDGRMVGTISANPSDPDDPFDSRIRYTPDYDLNLIDRSMKFPTLADFADPDKQCEWIECAHREATALSDLKRYKRSRNSNTFLHWITRKCGGRLQLPYGAVGG